MEPKEVEMITLIYHLQGKRIREALRNEIMSNITDEHLEHYLRMEDFQRDLDILDSEVSLVEAFRAYYRLSLAS